MFNVFVYASIRPVVVFLYVSLGPFLLHQCWWISFLKCCILYTVCQFLRLAIILTMDLVTNVSRFDSIGCFSWSWFFYIVIICSGENQVIFTYLHLFLVCFWFLICSCKNEPESATDVTTHQSLSCQWSHLRRNIYFSLLTWHWNGFMYAPFWPGELLSYKSSGWPKVRRSYSQKSLF